MNKNGFSIILPTKKAAEELNLCLKSLSLNSTLDNELIVIVDIDKDGSANSKVISILKERNIRFIKTHKNLGPYGCWNIGAKLANRQILCFITDDQYFAPDWDSEIIKYMSNNYIISGQLVEPGVLLPAFSTILKDFGESAKNFHENDFIQFVKKIRKERLVNGIFFIPLVIYKKNFINLGGFSTFGNFGIKSKPNDIYFIKKALNSGYKFKTSLSSISYHFQASSWEKHKKLRKWKNKLKLFLKKDLIRVQKI